MGEDAGVGTVKGTGILCWEAVWAEDERAAKKSECAGAAVKGYGGERRGYFRVALCKGGVEPFQACEAPTLVDAAIGERLSFNREGNGETLPTDNEREGACAGGILRHLDAEPERLDCTLAGPGKGLREGEPIGADPFERKTGNVGLSPEKPVPKTVSFNGIANGFGGSLAAANDDNLEDIVFAGLGGAVKSPEGALPLAGKPDGRETVGSDGAVAAFSKKPESGGVCSLESV